MESSTNNQKLITDFFAKEEAEEEMNEFFLFELDNELYAVLIADIVQVLKIPPVTAVPNTPDSIVGVFHLRGKVIVVIDLLKRMHLTRNRILVSTYLFIAHHQKNYFGILVDRIKMIIRVPVRQITPLNSVFAAQIPPRYSKGMFMYEESPEAEHKNNDSDFMITRETGEALTKKPNQARPVLWLNIEEILNQNDLLGIIPPP